MFDTIKHEHGAAYPQTVIHKHAPTSETMSLLREMREEVARDFANTHAPNNEILNVETWRRLDDRQIAYAFKLNGKLFHGTVCEGDLIRVERHVIADALFTALTQSLAYLEEHPCATDKS